MLIVLIVSLVRELYFHAGNYTENEVCGFIMVIILSIMIILQIVMGQYAIMFPKKDQQNEVGRLDDDFFVL